MEFYEELSMCPNHLRGALPLLMKFDGSIEVLFLKPLKLREFIVYSCSVVIATTFPCFSTLNNNLFFCLYFED